MTRPADPVIDWDKTARRANKTVDWAFTGVRGVVLSLLGLVRVTVEVVAHAVRWVRANREQIAVWLRRLVRPAQFLVGFAAGATVGAVAERAVLRHPTSTPYVADPTPYGTPGFIDAPDGRIYVHRHGSAGLPVVVLVHGWSNTHAIWHRQVRALRDRHHLVTYDQPGHGRSDQPKDWSMAVLGRGLRAVIEATGSDRVTLVGHSLGGASILELAQSDPGYFVEHVTGSVMIGTGASLTDRPTDAPLLARLERRVRLGGRLIELRRNPLVIALSNRSSDASHLAFRLTAFGASPDLADVDLTEQQWLDADPAMIHGIARAHENWNGRVGAARLPANTAVLGGARDLVLPPRLSRELADLVQTTDLTIVEGRGHQLHLEAPDLVSETIARIATKGAADGAGS